MTSLFSSSLRYTFRDDSCAWSFGQVIMVGYRTSGSEKQKAVGRECLWLMRVVCTHEHRELPYAKWPIEVSTAHSD